MQVLVVREGRARQRSAFRYMASARKSQLVTTCIYALHRITEARQVFTT
jgi:hypothetical protein